MSFKVTYRYQICLNCQNMCGHLKIPNSGSHTFYKLFHLCHHSMCNPNPDKCQNCLKKNRNTWPSKWPINGQQIRPWVCSLNKCSPIDLYNCIFIFCWRIVCLIFHILCDIIYLYVCISVFNGIFFFSIIQFLS